MAGEHSSRRRSAPLPAMAPTKATTATAKTHILKDCNLRSLLEPGSRKHAKFVATKGDQGRWTHVGALDGPRLGGAPIEATRTVPGDHGSSGAMFSFGLRRCCLMAAFAQASSCVARETQPSTRQYVHRRSPSSRAASRRALCPFPRLFHAMHMHCQRHLCMLGLERDASQGRPLGAQPLSRSGTAALHRRTRS